MPYKHVRTSLETNESFPGSKFSPIYIIHRHVHHSAFVDIKLLS